MTTLRRAVLAAVAVAFLALVPAAAQAATGNWANSAWDPAIDGTTATSAPTLSGAFVYSTGCTGLCSSFHIRQIVVGLHHQGDLPGGCADPDDQATNYPNSNGAQQAFAYTPAVGCNGTYDATATATVQGDLGYTPPDSTAQLTATVTVAIPADPPASTTAEVTGQDVAVSWVGPADPPPDFEGYQIGRVDSTGHEAVIVAGPTTSASLTDKGVGGGSYTYVVRSLRAGAAPSEATSSDEVTVVGPPATSSPSSSTDSDGSTSSGGTVVLGPPATSGPTTDVGGTSVQLGPSSRGKTTNVGGTPATAHGGEAVLPDEGFSSDLPYEPEPGALEAARPSVSATDGQPGAGLAVPGAVACVLFVWAMHILFVTRQARWADAGLVPVVIDDTPAWRATAALDDDWLAALAAEGPELDAPDGVTQDGAPQRRLRLRGRPPGGPDPAGLS